MMSIDDRIQELEDAVRRLKVAQANTASRGTLRQASDDNGMQQSNVVGLYGEELADLTVWQPFGLSAVSPPGSDALIVAIGGHRDGAQVIAQSHPQYRPRSGRNGETILYDAGGQQVALTTSGIRITDQFGNVVSLSSGGLTITAVSSLNIEATEVNIESSTLKHNGINIGSDHTHGGVRNGTGDTREPN